MKGVMTISTSQTALVLGAGLALAGGTVWYLDYRARTLAKAARDVVADVVNEESVVNPFYLGGLYAGYANWFWGKVGSIGRKSEEWLEQPDKSVMQTTVPRGAL